MNFYGVDYFLQRFGKIPANRWIKAHFSDCEGRHCVFGHLGATVMICGSATSEEMNALINLISEGLELPVKWSSVVAINDGEGHPKYNIIRALRRIQRRQSPKGKPHYKRREVACA